MVGRPKGLWERKGNLLFFRVRILLYNCSLSVGKWDRILNTSQDALKKS